VLYELAHREAGTSGTSGEAGVEGAELRRMLDLDAGYLSRILARFTSAGLVSRRAHPADARRQLVAVTDAGRAAYGDLDERQVGDVRRLLEPLSPTSAARSPRRWPPSGARSTGRRRRAASCCARRSRVTSAGSCPGTARCTSASTAVTPVRGDGGAHRGRYAAAHDPAREAVWIAEVDGRPAGSIACMAADAETARLRLLLVEPSARAWASASGWSPSACGSPGGPATGG